MKIYLVGGAVRDMIMNLEPKDKDYVVVGAEPQELLDLGFKQVGADFPVFLHPETGEEHALARTEKKNGVGYQGFNCYFGKDVTLEEDLARRDLTINAIAVDIETNEIIDPFNGRQDIKDKVLRPTTKAFCEDPLRVLRAARFLARYPEFRTSDKLNKLCCDVTKELNFLTSERVWLETEKALSEQKPSNYFNYLWWFAMFPEFDNLLETPQPLQHHPEGNCWNHLMLVIDHAAKYHKDSEIVFACLMHDMGKGIAFERQGNLNGHELMGKPIVIDFCTKYKIPNRYKELALIVCEYHTHCHKAFEMNPNKIMKLFERTKAESKYERFMKFLKACESDAKGRGGDFPSRIYMQPDYLKECLDAVKSVDTKSISAKMVSEGKSGLLIGEAIRVAKIDAIRGVKNKWK